MRDLVLRARKGDQAAFRELYERNARCVLGLLRHLLGSDKTKAEDALEETFVRAFGALGQFDVERPFGPWLKEIARNVVRDLQRARAAPLAPEAAATEDALSELVRREEEEALLDALVDLEEKERRVLILRYRKGLTQPETATELGCSRRTVANLQKSAVAHLARIVRERMGKPDPKKEPAP